MSFWQKVQNAMHAMQDNGHPSHGPDDIKVPETITPAGVILLNGLVLLVIWGVLSILFFPVWKWESLIWMGFATGALTGALIIGGAIAVDITDWYAAVVFNPFTGQRRVMFQGFHWKLLWERIEHPLESLKRHTAPTVVANFSTNDPAEKMDVKILIHVRPDTRPKKPIEDAEMFIRYKSVDEGERDEIIKAKVKKMFGQHYGTQEMEALGKLHEVQEAVLETNHHNHAEIHKMEKNFGVHIGVELEESLPDEATREMKRTPARAEGLRASKKILMAPGPEASTPEQAHREALLLDSNTDYTERKSSFDLNINAKGMKNVRDINITPLASLLGGDDKNKGGTKGGKK